MRANRAGGLPEASLGAGLVVPVEPIRIPKDDGGVPDWSQRSYPRQQVSSSHLAVVCVLYMGGRWLCSLTKVPLLLQLI